MLVTDDDPGVARAARLALERATPGVEVHIVEMGGHAIALLGHRAPFVHASRPSFAIIAFEPQDMTAAKISEHMRASDELRAIRVLVPAEALWEDQEREACAARAQDSALKSAGIHALRDAMTRFGREHVHASEGASG